MTVISDFKKFILRGNLLDMAIGFTVGAAFTSIAKSLVNDVIMPSVGYVLGGVDFSDLFLVLRYGKEGVEQYATLGAAQKAGAVTINYGMFINQIIAFLLVALAMFFIVRIANKVEDTLDEALGDNKPDPKEPSDKKCTFCLQVIPYRATRCAYCTSELAPIKAA